MLKKKLGSEKSEARTAVDAGGGSGGGCGGTNCNFCCFSSLFTTTFSHRVR